ncbi:hypothetical protein [Diaphorobacter caeni]|uniref:hypothetical protein n=1 Tax=Diaphorobacter caeni TaxID=2784387 RepID=UPI00188FBB1C|nr:hypothetical protein [Diaphorobacter caeni]MBF5004368.1 hypothetical protein [Diaphorobacter caeni]
MRNVCLGFDIQRLIFFASVLMLVSGCNLTNPQITIDCDALEATFTADQGVPTLDNTGKGAEIVQGIVKDGLGNVLGSQSFGPNGLGVVGSKLQYGPYALNQPKANPITVTLLTPAGGKVANDVVFHTYTMSCPGLPAAEMAPVPTVGASALVLGTFCILGLAGFRRRSGVSSSM